jgi:hypothetical protein
MMNKQRMINLSVPKRRYYNDECNLKICPECGSGLIEENCTILICAKSDSDEAELMTNLSGSHFCSKCPVVVFDLEKVEKAAKHGIRWNNNLKYFIAGIIDLEAIPKDKRYLEIGCDENPVPLVHFLPDLGNVPKISEKWPGRNDPCSCGSGKKYKKCCGK